MEIVELPDRLTQNLLIFLHQNGGALPNRRHGNAFVALTDNEVKQIEEIYRDVFNGKSAMPERSSGA